MFLQRFTILTNNNHPSRSSVSSPEPKLLWLGYFIAFSKFFVRQVKFLLYTNSLKLEM